MTDEALRETLAEMEADNEDVFARFPDQRAVAAVLIGMGGSAVCFCDCEAEDCSLGSVHSAEQIRSRARKWVTAGLVLERAGASCYGGAYAIWKRDPQRYAYVVGWSLAPDGVWYQHGWVWDRSERRIVEPTAARTLYFGYECRAEEIRAFPFAD